MNGNPQMASFFEALQSWANWTFLICLIACIGYAYVFWTIPTRKQRLEYNRPIYIAVVVLVAAVGFWKLGHIASAG